MGGTIVEAELSAEDFTLEHTLDTFETVVFEVEQTVTHNHDSRLPYIWVETEKREAIEQAFTDDDTVVDFQLLSDVNTACLYRLEWTNRIDDYVHGLVEEKGVLLSATGQDDTWQLRLLFPDRDAVTRTYENCEDKGISLNIQNITQFEREQHNKFGLSEEQQTILRLAYDLGYYSVPREANATDLADEVGISHQAVSERLRRGIHTLVKHALADSYGFPNSL